MNKFALIFSIVAFLYMGCSTEVTECLKVPCFTPPCGDNKESTIDMAVFNGTSFQIEEVMVRFQTESISFSGFDIYQNQYYSCWQELDTTPTIQKISFIVDGTNVEIEANEIMVALDLSDGGDYSLTISEEELNGIKNYSAFLSVWIPCDNSSCS